MQGQQQFTGMAAQTTRAPQALYQQVPQTQQIQIEQTQHSMNQPQQGQQMVQYQQNPLVGQPSQDFQMFPQ